MGLDQYAWALTQKPEKKVDFKLGSDDFITDEGHPDCWVKDKTFGSLFKCKPESGVTALAYWRKHPDLHGFLREVYRAKGGKDFQWDEFSGPLVLDEHDLDDLEKAVLEKKLPKTSGFFFGESTEERDAPTLEFIKRARAAIADGKTVVYDSSW